MVVLTFWANMVQKIKISRQFTHRDAKPVAFLVSIKRWKILYQQLSFWFPWLLAPGVEIRLFCLTGHFWCWRKSSCSSPIATKRLQWRCSKFTVLPSFFLKKCLICRKLTFPHFFGSIVFSKNTVMLCHLVPSFLEIQSRTKLTYPQSQHSKRLLNVIGHRHTIKYNPFDL